MDRALVDCVANCLAKLDDCAITMVDWKGEVGESYRDRATSVLATIDRYYIYRWGEVRL
jgi:hypothetical protein